MSIKVVTENAEILKSLKPVSPRSKVINESFIQELIYKEPSLLPVNEINPEYTRLIPLGKEISVPSGSIDVFYTTPCGILCIAETKLYRNPDAHRTVNSANPRLCNRLNPI